MIQEALGDQRAFSARVSSHAAHRALSEFQLVNDMLRVALPNRSKLLLDPAVGGRRQVWLADPWQAVLARFAAERRMNRPPEEPRD